MNIIIADDEDLARSSLISMLLELDLPIKIIGEASNGEELVKLCQTCHADVAFVDIKMPKMDGLTAIETLKGACNFTSWIILSGYSEFEYAKEAIKSGVVDYLLKPVSPDQLARTLNSILGKNKKYLVGLNKEFEHDVIALSNDLISQSDFDMKSIISLSHFVGGIFVVDSFMNQKTAAHHLMSFRSSIYSLINESLKYEIKLAFFILPSGEMATIGAWGYTNSKDDKNMVYNYFNKLEHIIKQNSNNDFSFVLLQSDVCNSFDSLQKQMNQLQNLAPIRMVMDKQWRIIINDLIKQYRNSSSQIIELTSIISKLAQYFNEKSFLNYMNTIDELERFLNGNKSISYDEAIKLLKRLMNNLTKYKFDDCKNISTMIKIFRNTSDSLFKDESSKVDVVDQIRAYVEQNYMHVAGIAQLAQLLDITPNYLSYLFHKKTGETFVKYLTKFRMQKARELLYASNTQVNKVAEQVGYFSTRHFTKLYKECYGVNPSEHLI